MKIKTELLQKMVAKSIQGASNNKNVPITSLIGVQVIGSVLVLMTTDGSNQLRIMGKLENDNVLVEQEFYTIVNAETFSKLVSKTTKGFIELENNNNYLEMKGNGTYKLDIAINEDGEMVRFSDIPLSKATNSGVDLSIQELKNAIDVSKASILKTNDVPCLTGFYVGEKIITTDRQLVCNIDKRLVETPLLISSEMANLICLLDGETVYLVVDGNHLLFQTDDITIYGDQLEGSNIYPVASINSLLSLPYSNNVVVKKGDLLDVLDRMGLFIKQNDNNSIYLDFSKCVMQIRSKDSNAVEIINVVGNEDEDDNSMFTCLVDIDMFKSQVNTISTDSINIYYGQGKSIKLVDGNCTHVVSLVENAVQE